MPRPPVLAPLDWKPIFDRSHDYQTWLAAAESPDAAQRMREDEKRQEFGSSVAEVLAAVDRTVHVVAFAEDWCGDVVRHVPVLQAMARSLPHLKVRYCSRAEAPGAFVRFLTNGGEAIPKFVFLSEDFVETGHWGPMPDALRDVISRGKACGDVGTARQITARLYDEDPGRHDVARELADRIAIACARRP